MQTNILITGATGIIGASLVKKIINDYSDCTITILSRSSQQEVLNKFSHILTSEQKERITVFTSALNIDNLGLSWSDYTHCISTVTHIIHLAASTRFNLPLDEIRMINVQSTLNLMEFAKNCKDLRRVIHVSTTFVAGQRTGIILESELEHSAGFINNYEQSKYEAELAIEEYKKELPLIIARPSLVISSKAKNEKSPINAISLALFLARKGFLPLLPGDGSYKLDLVDGEDVAFHLAHLSMKSETSSYRYHISNLDGAISVSELLRLVVGEKPVEYCKDMQQFHQRLMLTTKLRPDLKYYYSKTETFLSEIAYPKVFDNSNLRAELESQYIWADTRKILKVL